VPSTAGKRNVI